MKFPVQKSQLKYFLLPVLLIVLGVSGFFVVKSYLGSTDNISSDTNANTIEAIAKEESKGIDTGPDFEGIETDPSKSSVALSSKTSEKEALRQSKGSNSPSDKTKPFNILVLGIDRRHGDQTSWRTDVIQLLTISADRSKAIVTHIPRDVWTGSYKINSLYNLQGPEAMKDAVESVTGQRPDRILRIDFDAFVYMVDGVGGINIDVPVGFTDSEYPNDRAGDTGTITVEFAKGPQVMDGETALQYTRSRKGSNGEGSDYARGKRQQQVMKAVVTDFFKPNNLINPKTAEALYNFATKKIYTDVTLADSKVLFELMKNYKGISLTNLGLDTSNYLMVPSDKAPYGGAWVLIPKDNNYQPIHDAIANSVGLSSETIIQKVDQ